MSHKRPNEDINSTHHNKSKKRKLRADTTHLPPYPPLSKTQLLSTHSSALSDRLPPLPPITPDLRTQVFTHTSAIAGESNIAKVNISYERLEVLGDAYLELAATKKIYSSYPNYTAGQMSQQREVLIKNETLAMYSQAYGFDKLVQVGRETAEKAKHDRGTWLKLMGDVMEAYVAAVVLSNPEGGKGQDMAEAWCLAMWRDLLPKPEESTNYDPMAKVSLGAAIVSKGIKLEYLEDEEPRMLKEKGKTVYSIGVYLTGWGYEKKRLGFGQGLRHKEAGQRAAMEALKSENVPELKETKRRHDEKVKRDRGMAEEAAMSRPV